MPWFANRGQVVQIGLQVLTLLTGATVLSAITGLAQKLTGLSPDWWILGSVFVGGLCVMGWVSFMANKLRDKGSLGREAYASTLPLKPNQIVYPSSKNGVLWEGLTGGGLSGPFCPTHRVALLYWPVHGTTDRVTNFKEDDYLTGNGNFECPIDDEEFTFIRLRGMKVGALRAQALAQFQAEQDRRRASGE